MYILYAMLGGFALDWLFGDPAWLTHPVVIMGKAISALERALRARLPKTPRGERLGGLTLAIVLPVGTLLLTGGVCRVLGVQLAGPATYFGEYYDKPTIGYAARAIEPNDILRANRMMRVASVLGLIAATGIRLMIGV